MKPTEGVRTECHYPVIYLTNMLEFDLKSVVGLVTSLFGKRCVAFIQWGVGSSLRAIML